MDTLIQISKTQSCTLRSCSTGKQLNSYLKEGYTLRLAITRIRQFY